MPNSTNFLWSETDIEHELIMESDANEVVASDSQSELRAHTAALGDGHNGSGSQRSHFVRLKQLYRLLAKITDASNFLT